MASKHEYIAQQLRELYVDGRPAGESLPTERTLAETFEVNRATVRQALSQLERDGLVSRIQGSGTFTMGETIAKSLKMTSFSEDIRLRGMTPSSRVLGVERVGADVTVAQQLHLSPGDPVIRIARLQLANAVPMCVETVCLAAAVAPDLAEQEQELSGSLYDLLVDKYGIKLVRAEQTVTATVVTAEESELLGVPPYSPALRVVRTAMDARSKPLEYTTTLYRADRYQIRFSVRRDS